MSKLSDIIDDARRNIGFGLGYGLSDTAQATAYRQMQAQIEMHAHAQHTQENFHALQEATEGILRGKGFFQDLYEEDAGLTIDGTCEEVTTTILLEGPKAHK